MSPSKFGTELVDEIDMLLARPRSAIFGLDFGHSADDQPVGPVFRQFKYVIRLVIAIDIRPSQLLLKCDMVCHGLGQLLCANGTSQP